MSISPKFQERLLDLINENGKDKSVIANESGVDYGSLSHAINYGIVPKPITLIKIADYFDISVEYLLAITDDEYFDKSKNPVHFIERLNELVESNKITYYKLATTLNYGRSYFSELKKHRHIPTLDNLSSIADYFDVSLDYLLGRTDDKNI